MKRRFVKITNDFHNTDYYLRVNQDNILTYTQIIRAKKHLCGIEGCTCGDVAGCRPAQIEQISQGKFVTDNKYQLIT